MKQLTFILFILLILGLGLTSVGCTSQSNAPQNDAQTAEVAEMIEAGVSSDQSLEMGDIFTVVDDMPLFGNCEDARCSDDALIAFIQSHTTYPEEAKTNGLEGRVYVEFVITKEGRVVDINVLKDIGGGTAEVARQVVEHMNDEEPLWRPGRQDGQEVNVKYVLPITFTLS